MSDRDCQSAAPTQLAGLLQGLFRPGGSRLPGGVADYPLQRRRVETADKATQPIDGALRLPHIPPRSRKEDAELLRTDFVTAATAAVDEVLHRAAHCAGPRRRIEHDDLRVDHPRGQMGHIVLQRADTAFDAAVAAPQAGVDSKVAEKHLGHLVARLGRPGPEPGAERVGVVVPTRIRRYHQYLFHTVSIDSVFSVARAAGLKRIQKQSSRSRRVRPDENRSSHLEANPDPALRLRSAPH